MVLEDFNAKFGTEDIFKQTVENDSLHTIGNYNKVIVEKFPTSKNLTVKNTVYSYYNNRKCTLMSPDGKT
jgi:hypothetical protein